MELTPEQFRLVAAIFAKACKMPEEQRNLYLDEACHEHVELRTQVQQLLDDDAQPAFSLESPPLASVLRAQGAALFDDPSGRPGQPQRIGRYEIVGVLGEGGMGIVYEAKQEHPARSVALKVLRPGIVSSTAQRRLQQEAEILGQLQHPGIASIYEAGMAEGVRQGGRSIPQPFFAMELIRGRPLDVFVAENKLPYREKLRVFAQICDAVQHAHNNGIIHRDLKPGNILVDESGAPKILDFGIARVTDADIRMTTLQTGVGQLIGTIAYMSPEQVGGNPRELDTRSDVYALGVIGYELLAGSPPQDLGHVPIPEAVRLIRDGDPTPLSSINKVFRGDLDIIFAKALDKDRKRRYQTAAALAEDIRRHLRDEPIAARRPSTIYHFRKFARRHKAFTTSVTLLFLVIASSGVWMGLLYRHADRQARRARQTQQFLEKMLASIDPVVAKGKDTSIIRGILDEAAKRVGIELAQQPEAEADIRATIGAAYLSVGLTALAQPQLEAALAIRRRLLGDEHQAVATTLRLLAECTGKQGHRERAEGLARQALALRRKQYGSGDLEVAEALQTLGWILSELGGDHPEAVSLFRESLEITDRIAGPDQPLYAEGLHRLAVALWRWQRYHEAETIARETLALKRQLYGPDHPSVVNAMDLLGQILTSRKEYGAAEPLLRESVEMHRRLFGEDHPVFVTALNSWVQLLIKKGDYEAAEPLARRCLDLVTHLRGEDSHETAFAWMNLANLIDKKGDFADAQRLYRGADQRFRKVFPPDHPYVHSPLTRLAEMLDRNGKHESAEPLWRQVVSETRREFPVGHAYRGLAVTKALGLGRCLLSLRRCAEAEELFLECHDDLQAGTGTPYVEATAVVKDLVRLYQACGPAEKAEEFRVLLKPADSTPP